MTTQRYRCYYCFHFTDEKIEAQRATLPHRQNGDITQNSQLLGAEMQLIALRIKEKVLLPYL